MKEKKRLAKESSSSTDVSNGRIDSHLHHTHSENDCQNEEVIHTHNHTHTHTHTKESLRKIINRLSRIEGHIRGIKSMVEQSSPCPDVLLQIAAVRGALDKVARIVLDEHLTECIARAAKEGDIDLEIQELKAALDRFLP
ncbi:MAG: metal-sensing transcriptional repressor [Cyanobacteria bacterium P01_A01_bin.45]